MFKRVNGKLVAAPAPKEDRPKVLIVDGSIMAILRPMTQEAADQAIAKALELARLESVDEPAFRDIIVGQEQMIFMGLASTDGRLLDPRTLEVVGPMIPGDSFVAYDQLQALPPEAVEQPS